MKTRIIVSILLVLAIASVAQAASQKDLQAFIGTWSCTGIAFASEMGPEHPTSATVTGRWTLGGKWLLMRYTEVKTSKNPKPFDVAGYWMYDDAQNKFIAVSADNMGGYATTESDSGWSGDEFVFTGSGHMGTMVMNGRDVFTRSGKSTIKHRFEMQDPSGNWKKLDEETCKKQ